MHRMNEFATTAFLRLLPGRLLPGRTGVVCLLSGMLCLAAPGQVQQGGKQAADTAEKKRIANEPVPIAPPGIGTAAPVDPKSYKIGSEDVLRIQVWKEPELGGLMTVRPDGIITVDLVGEIQASGLTPDQLTQKLKEEYAKLINNPIVIVSVHQVRSKKYYLSGGLMRNGEVPLVVPTTVMEALSIAGGFTEFANKKKVVILRGDKRYFFNYNEVAKGKKLEQNIYLENGDFIIVN